MVHEPDPKGHFLAKLAFRSRYAHTQRSLNRVKDRWTQSHLWGPPRVLGNRRTRTFISGEQGNTGNREHRKLIFWCWGTREQSNLFQGNKISVNPAWVGLIYSLTGSAVITHDEIGIGWEYQSNLFLGPLFFVKDEKKYSTLMRIFVWHPKYFCFHWFWSYNQYSTGHYADFWKRGCKFQVFYIAVCLRILRKSRFWS